MGLYAFLSLINIVAITVQRIRPAVALVSGLLHLILGILHAYRTTHPFTFEVFGHHWPLAASLRESWMAGMLGLGFITLAIYLFRAPKVQTGLE
jgi:hypothetical protein